MPSDRLLGQAGFPRPASWQGLDTGRSGWGQAPVTPPVLCATKQTRPCLLIALSFPSCKWFLCLHLLFAHPTPLPPFSGAVLGSRHGRCFSAARSLISNCFPAPSRMWDLGGGLRKRGRDEQQERKSSGRGCRKQGRGRKSENREEEERERMLSCLFLALYRLSCTGLAKSGAELPSPPLSSRQALVFGVESLNSLQLQPAPN